MIQLHGFENAGGVPVIEHLVGDKWEATWADVPDRVPFPLHEAANILRAMADTLDQTAAARQ